MESDLLHYRPIIFQQIEPSIAKRYEVYSFCEYDVYKIFLEFSIVDTRMKSKQTNTRAKEKKNT